MTETENRKKLADLSVVQANDFIQQTNWMMDKVPLKLLKAFIACIDTSNPPKDGKVVIEKKELMDLLDAGENYDYLKTRIRQLQQTSLRVEDVNGKEHYVALLTDFYWEKDDVHVEVQFHKSIMPYLLTISRFLKYPAANLPNFKSKYGLILYEQLLSRERQYHTGEYTISIAELRWITGTEKLYKKFVNFEAKVLKAGIDDMNKANVEILARYEKVKRGRNIDAIKFIVRKRTSWKEKSYEQVVNPSMLINKESI